jgi:thiamine-phosphate pyrophosphorylase
MLNGLYVITEEISKPTNDNLTKIENVLKGGANIIQLRNKHSHDDELLSLSYDIKQLCNNYNALFIIDDRISLAKRVDAHGVHIGKFDAKISQVKEYIPNKIIGVSCYGNVNYAKMMENSGADYVAFGSFFHSPTKPESNIVPIKTIYEAKKVLSVPICVIGGITLENAPLLISQGADMVSIISDIWNSEDLIQKAQSYTQLFKEQK